MVSLKCTSFSAEKIHDRDVFNISFINLIASVLDDKIISLAENSHKSGYLSEVGWSYRVEIVPIGHSYPNSF